MNSVFTALENLSKVSYKVLDTDTVDQSEAVAKTFSTTINNTDSTVSFTESISGVRTIIDYSDPTYFSETYVSSGTENVI